MAFSTFFSVNPYADLGDLFCKFELYVVLLLFRVLPNGGDSFFQIT